MSHIHSLILAVGSVPFDAAVSGAAISHRVMFSVLAAVALAVFFVADKVLGRRRKEDGARLARGGELKLLRNATGIPLGSRNGQQLRAEDNASVMLVGPTQSGKTLSCVARTILTWGDRPLIVLSVKADLLSLTVAERQRLGPVLVFDPTGQTDRETATWSPTVSASSWARARSISAGLLQIGQEPAERDREPFWREAADQFLAPLLLAAHEAGASMRTVVSWVALRDQDEPRAALEQSSDPYARDALEALEHVWSADQRYATSVLGTLSTALRAWSEPGVAEATNEAGITPEWLCAGGARTVYIVAPSSHQRRLQNLFAGLLSWVIDGATEIAQQTPAGRLDPPLLAVLDELANAAPLPQLDQIASSGSGQGILLLSVLQSVSQAIQAWGSERAATVIASHRARLFWAGASDARTFEYLDRILGHEQLERKSRTRQRNGTSTTEAHEWRPLVPPHRLREAKPGTALLVYGQMPPVWTDQPLVFDDKRLRERLAS
jgi:type IV secretion system protein VirD4